MTDNSSLSPNHSFQNYEGCANVLPEMAPALNCFSSFCSSKRVDKFCLIQSLLNLSVSTNIDGVNPESGGKVGGIFITLAKLVMHISLLRIIEFNWLINF